MMLGLSSIVSALGEKFANFISTHDLTREQFIWHIPRNGMKVSGSKA